jgi:hypothetical protein
MFTNPFKLNTQRTALGAIGFYITYLFMLLIIAMSFGILIANSFETGFVVGNIVAVILCLTVSFSILVQKNALSLGKILIALSSGLLAVLGGGLLGLIPVSYLSTIPNNKTLPS